MQLPSINGETDAAKRERYGLNEMADRLLSFSAKAREKRNHLSAIIAARRAIGICPDAGILWNALGTALWDTADYPGALQAFTRAGALGFVHSQHQSNLGLVLTSLQRWAEAEAHFLKALELDKNDLKAKWNLCTLYLVSGQWDKGLPLYELRFDYMGTGTYSPMPYRPWNGEDLSGKKILICGEQGIGDRILFTRYVHWLKQTYPTAHILYQCGNSLAPLLYRYVEEGICELVPDYAPWPRWADYGAWLMSLPLHHGTTLGNVYPDPGLIRDNAVIGFHLEPPPTPMLKVGIVWEGGKQATRSEERDIPFSMLYELADNPKVQLYSLQFESDELDKQGANGLVINLDIQTRKHGLLATAAAMKQMDLIITADTATAHLAGALGLRCWVLLCEDPYWVWQQRFHRTPWYPNTQMLRMEPGTGWGFVIDNLKVALTEFADSFLAQNHDSPPAAVNM